MFVDLLSCRKFEDSVKKWGSQAGFFAKELAPVKIESAPTSPKELF
jgi:hypothetical protein